MKVVIAKGPYSCVVRPGHVITRPGGVITFKANNSLTMPVQITVDPGFGIGGPIVLEPGQSHPLQIPAQLPEGVYVYKVFCQDTGTLASAGSDPEIIIDN